MSTTEIVSLEGLKPAELFAEKGSRSILANIEEKALSIVSDVETEKGRKEIASLAYQIAKSKTALDKLGKEFVSDLKSKAKIVDGERSSIRTFLDELKDKVRDPLNRWEKAEELRVEIHKTNIQIMDDHAEFCGVNCTELDPDEIVRRLDVVKGIQTEKGWEEFAESATLVREASIKSLEDSLAKCRQWHSDQAELVRLRTLEADRVRLEEEEKLRKEGEDRVKAEAEEKDKTEQIEKEKQRVKYYQSMIQHINQCAIGMIDGQPQAFGILFYELEEKIIIDDSWGEFEAPAIEARNKAVEQLKKQQADVAEKAEAEEKKKAEDAAEAVRLRETNKEHRKAVNNKALDGLLLLDINRVQAKSVIEAIAKGLIPGITISY